MVTLCPLCTLAKSDGVDAVELFEEAPDVMPPALFTIGKYFQPRVMLVANSQPYGVVLPLGQ